MLTTEHGGKKITQQLTCYSTEQQAVEDIHSEFSLEGGYKYVWLSEEELLRHEQPNEEIRKYKVILTVEEIAE